MSNVYTCKPIFHRHPFEPLKHICRKSSKLSKRLRLCMLSFCVVYLFYQCLNEWSYMSWSHSLSNAIRSSTENDDCVRGDTLAAITEQR